MSKKFLFTACGILFSTIISAQNYITLFEDCNYKGKSYYLEAGTYRGYQMKIDNSNLDSIDDLLRELKKNSSVKEIDWT